MTKTRNPAAGGTPERGLKRDAANVNLCLNPTMKPRIVQPRLNPLTRIGLERYLSEITNSPFISREFNVALPTLIIEIMRISAEVNQ